MKEERKKMGFERSRNNNGSKSEDEKKVTLSQRQPKEDQARTKGGEGSFAATAIELQERKVSLSESQESERAVVVAKEAPLSSPSASLSSRERLRELLEQSLHGVGPAVLHGALSSLIGIAPCFLSSSAPLQIFGRVFVAIVVFSFVHGVFTFPLLLSVLSPLSRARDRKEGRERREETKEAAKTRD